MFGEITGEKLAGGSFAPPPSPILNRVKNSAETNGKEFRDKSEISTLNFAILRYTLRL